jgi:hypothetical protein
MQRLPALTSLSRHRHYGSPACEWWPAPGTLKVDLLMTPNRRRPVELLGPLSAAALTAETAFQPPVENQQA